MAPTGDPSESLNAVKVGVLDSHDASVREYLLREVVDQLSVDEAVDAVVDDLAALVAHLVSLRFLDVCHLRNAAMAYICALDPLEVIAGFGECPVQGQMRGTDGGTSWLEIKSVVVYV